MKKENDLDLEKENKILWRMSYFASVNYTLFCVWIFLFQLFRYNRSSATSAENKDQSFFNS